MNNYLVFREEPVNESGILHRQQHNERQLECYANANIDLGLVDDNIYFKKPANDYMAILQKRLDVGELSRKGLQEDAALFSEIVVGVNSDFWLDKDEAYKQAFFKEVYEYLKSKFGGENIISCVWHRDEIHDGKINEHLHCVAIPTAKKKRYYSKRSVQYQEILQAEGKVNPNDERLLKGEEVQISHSKFFGSAKDEHHRIIYSYSLWQDELAVHMQKKGFDIRRGITGQSGVKHLSPLQYKAVMERFEIQGKLYEEDLHPVEKCDGTVELSSSEYNAVVALNTVAAKQNAAYAEAVEVYMQEQKKLTEEKHKAYVVALQQSKIDFDEMQYEELKKEAKRLQEENTALRAAIDFIKNKVTLLINHIQKIIGNWIILRTDTSADFNNISSQMDSDVNAVIQLLNNKTEYWKLDR